MGTLIINQYLSKLWTPAEMTTALWLDAADSSTITESAGLLSQWDDKSGNNNHATQNTQALKPIYTLDGLNGKPVLDFANTRWLGSTANALGTVTQFNAVVVWETNVNGAENYDYLYQVGTGNNALSLSAASTTAGSYDGNYYFLTSNDPPAAKDGATPAVIGSPVISSHIIQADFPRNNLWINGSARTISSTLPQALNSEGTYRLSNLISLNTHFLDGYIAEIVFVVNQALSTADRQKLEGYLAHKWGLTANLPVTHPYKNTPPYV